MDPKSTVVKSKSSNSAISKKPEEGPRRECNKKTKSTAALPSHGLKKRGVYVEKRSTKTNLINNGKEVNCATPKAPARPRPGQKKFLASVLTILSKSTTGTQYPDEKEDTSDINEALTKMNDEDRIKVNDSKNAKEKFKSKILGKKSVREDKKKMVVLQSKKEIAQTPSNYSQWSYKDASENSNVSNLMICEDLKNEAGLNIADELKRAVLEGRNVKVKKISYLENEPKTLVSDVPKDPNLYNFFVDLLETTISVYNVKAEYDANDPNEASKTNLQINESVADKLNIVKAKKAVEFEDGVISPEHYKYTKSYIEQNRNIMNSKTERIIMEPFKPDEPIRSKIRKLRRDFVYPNVTKRIPQKSKSVEMSRKTTFRKKIDLINVLKQELEVETDSFEEPKSIFQALKVMARNNKRITFDTYLDNESITDECVLKRRKIISSRRVKKINKAPNKNYTKPVKPLFQNTNDLQYIRKPTATKRRDGNNEIDSESCHSLEVYGYDYEMQSSKKPNLNTEKGEEYCVSSSSEVDFDLQESLLNTVSPLSSIRKIPAVD